MSGGGGGNKNKKPTKTQGWEEAGSEFYQESYPTDAEFEVVLQKDPKHLATLLPSKQTRAAAATIRMRTHDNRTMRRQTSSRSRRESTVHRRTSTTTAGEVQVSMLPDLSENLSNEQTTWEEIMEIKAMPVPMSEKKELKAKILNEPNLRLQGYEQFKWKRRKMWRQFESRLKESYTRLELWRGDLKRIEGHFGTGVVAYFLFLKWLLYLNLFIFSVVFLFVILPMILLDEPHDCSLWQNITYSPSATTWLLDFVQGTGFMECSPLFYGYYPNATFVYNTGGNSVMYYNLPLAYILVALVYFGVSLISIVRSAARGFRERLIEGEGQFYQYCNLIFGGWDFCIHNEKSAVIKHKAIFNEIKGSLAAARLEEIKQNRTREEFAKLILIRIIVHTIVLSVLAACGCAIYFVFDFCRQKLETREVCSDNFEQLFYEFLPFIIIVCFNLLVPFLLRYLVTFENYSPTFVIRITLIRTVLLRLSSLIVLYATLKSTVESGGNNTCKTVDCWETYVGQQIYKLVLTDFAVHILVTFLLNFPRALLANHVSNKFVKFVGEQNFDLDKHVLDVVYSQTLCWLGCFYAPLLSSMFVIIFFLMFQIKKFACLFNSKPSNVIYRASRSNSMFMLILLVAFVFAVLPVAYAISMLTPSKNCGPFRNLTTVWSRVVLAFSSAPDWLQQCIYFLGTAGFAVPLCIALVMLVYYYRAINSANRHLVTVLKNQLVLEGHDKQFLLERLSKFIKQQQEQQKRLRHAQAAAATAAAVAADVNRRATAAGVGGGDGSDTNNISSH